MSLSSDTVFFHCREVGSRKQVFGSVEICRSHITAHLYNYDEDFLIDVGKPIFLEDDTGRIVSLFFAAVIASGRRGRSRKPSKKIFYKNITAGLAVVGDSCWTETTLIKQVDFSCNSAQAIFADNNKIKELYDKKSSDKNNILFSEELDLLKITAWCSEKYGVYSHHPQEINVKFQVSFKQDVSITAYINEVIKFVQFLSYSVGSYLNPDDILLSSHLLEEAETNDQALFYYSAHYVLPEVNNKESSIRVWSSMITAENDKELLHFCRCMICWIQRSDKWKNANCLMMDCIALSGEVTSTRLLTAYKWLEEIPILKRHAELNSESLRVIVKAASRAAENLGHRGLNNRIAGSLKSITSESRKQFFERLKKVVGEKVKSNLADQIDLDDLINASRFRGRCAHRYFIPKDQNEFDLLHRAILAIEALCVLISAIDMPISTEGIERIADHPLFRSYRLLEKKGTRLLGDANERGVS